MRASVGGAQADGGEEGRERMRSRELTWPLGCVICVVSPGILLSLLLSADVDSLGIFNEALIPTVIEPLARLIRL